jgi:hypothetical protein
MNKLIKLLAVAAPLALSLNANAATYSAGTIGPGTYTNSFSAPSSNQAGGENLDHFLFTLASTADITVFGQDFADGYVLGRMDLITGGPAFSFIATGTPSFNILGLAAGNYQINFKNESGNLATGSFTGGVTVAAVPEPETYAMLLAGLGLIGFSARRRQA